MKATKELAKHVAVGPACDALRVSRATFYRRPRPSAGYRQPPPDPRPSVERKGTRRGLRHPVLRAVRGPVASRGGGDRAGRGGVPVLRTHDVSRSGLPRVGSGAPSAKESSRIQQTRVDGDRPRSALVLGHHSAAGAEEVELLLPLCHPGHLQAATSWAGWWRIGCAKVRVERWRRAMGFRAEINAIVAEAGG